MCHATHIEPPPQPSFKSCWSPDYSPWMIIRLEILSPCVELTINNKNNNKYKLRATRRKERKSDNYQLRSRIIPILTSYRKLILGSRGDTKETRTFQLSVCILFSSSSSELSLLSTLVLNFLLPEVNCIVAFKIIWQPAEDYPSTHLLLLLNYRFA